jgi:hypothetical protein
MVRNRKLYSSCGDSALRHGEVRWLGFGILYLVHPWVRGVR